MFSSAHIISRKQILHVQRVSCKCCETFGFFGDNYVMNAMLMNSRRLPQRQSRVEIISHRETPEWPIAYEQRNNRNFFVENFFNFPTRKCWKNCIVTSKCRVLSFIIVRILKYSPKVNTKSTTLCNVRWVKWNELQLTTLLRMELFGGRKAWDKLNQNLIKFSDILSLRQSI